MSRYQLDTPLWEKDEKDEGARGVPRWIVGYADLMTLLLCFFIVMFSFSEPIEEEFNTFASGLSEVSTPDKAEMPYFFGNSATEKASAVVQDGNPTEKWREITQELSHAIRLSDVDTVPVVETEEERVRIRLDDAGLFPSGSSILNGSFNSVLSRIGGILASSGGHIEVHGHTDNVPIESRRFHSNWDLSASRASAVVNALQAATPIPHDRISVKGFGESQPVVSNQTAEGRAKNRRVEIMLTFPKP